MIYNYRIIILILVLTIGFSTTDWIRVEGNNNSELILGYRLKILRWDMGKSSGISGDGSDEYMFGYSHYRLVKNSYS